MWIVLLLHQKRKTPENAAKTRSKMSKKAHNETHQKTHSKRNTKRKQIAAKLMENTSKTH
jgi:hypothetical protein